VLRHIRLLVLDLDYLVFDGRALKLKALRQSLVAFADTMPQSARLPDEVDLEDAYLQHGRRWLEFLDLGLEGDLLASLKEAYRVYEDRLIQAGNGIIFPGTAELLDVLRRNGIGLALGADCGRDYLLDVSDHHDLANTFAVSLCTEEFGKGNIDEMLQEALILGEVNRSEAVVLGTRSKYFQAARDLNLASIGCGWGIRRQESLPEADQKAAIPAEIPVILRMLDEQAARFES
jgi:phosphoglycolate phosphatase-like HAD superfamily hydrolase